MTKEARRSFLMKSGLAAIAAIGVSAFNLPQVAGVATPPANVVVVAPTSDSGLFGPFTAGTTTSGIQEAINSLPNGGMVFIKAGTYTVATGIVVNDKIALVGESRDAVIIKQANGANLNIIMIDVATGAYLANFTVDGNKANSAGFAGIFVATFAATTGVLIENVLIKNTTAHAIDVGEANSSIVTRIMIRDCVAMNPGGDGFKITNSVAGNSKECSIIGCVAISPGDTGFVLQNCDKCLVADCIVLNPASTGFYALGETRCVIQGCIVQGSSNNGFVIGPGSDGLRVAGCISEANAANGIIVLGATNLFIEGTLLRANGGISISGLSGTNNLAVNNQGFNPQPLADILVGASPFTYTNNDGFPEQINLKGGTVSQIQFVRNGASINFALRSNPFPLQPGDGLIVVYTAAPTMTKIPS